MMEAGRSRVRTVYLVLALNLVLMVLLVATIAYVAGLRDRVEQSSAQQRQACSRGNLVRASMNYNNSVTQTFLLQAATTREQQSQHDLESGDPVAANINQDAAKAYRVLAQGFSSLKIIDCESIYP